jgi:hypothetical protein
MFDRRLCDGGSGKCRRDDVIFSVGARNESCMLSLMSALPVNSHRSMKTFAIARWFPNAEGAQETRDPKTHSSLHANGFDFTRNAKCLEQLSARNGIGPLPAPRVLDFQRALRLADGNVLVDLFGSVPCSISASATAVTAELCALTGRAI